jgi:hypothetical protein
VDDDSAACAACGSTTQVNWSPVHGWACAECRRVRSNDLLSQPVTALPADGDDDTSPFDTSFLTPQACLLCGRTAPWHDLFCDSPLALV